MSDESYSREESRYLKAGLYISLILLGILVYFVANHKRSSWTTADIIRFRLALTGRTACWSEIGSEWPA